MHKEASAIDGVRQSLRQHWTRLEARYQIVFACFLATFTTYVERVGFPLAFTALAKDADIGEGKKGTVMSAFFWGYALSQVSSCNDCSLWVHIQSMKFRTQASVLLSVSLEQCMKDQIRRHRCCSEQVCLHGCCPHRPSDIDIVMVQTYAITCSMPNMQNKGLQSPCIYQSPLRPR